MDAKNIAAGWGTCRAAVYRFVAALGMVLKRKSVSQAPGPFACRLITFFPLFN